jgi:hypothetical protein
MFNWLFKKKDKVFHIEHLPGFNIRFESNNNVHISASWARATNEDEMSALVKGFVALLALIDEGRLTPVFQHAISKFGTNHNDEDTAKVILMSFNDFIEQQLGTVSGISEPVVRPTEAFR